MKKIILPFRISLMLVLLLYSYSGYSQTTISSISELVDALDDVDANIKMTPGTYRIGPDDVTSGLLATNPIFEFTGTNSTYDFTGVTIEVETEIFQSYGNVQVKEIYVLGTGNLLQNLTLVDIGSAIPTRSALSMTLDGVDNTVDGFHISTSGSYPYGYGDMFGKSGSGNIIGHKKHSAIRVSGDRPHIKNLTLIHRAYGHAVAFQGSVDAVIEDSYIEGEMNTTDDVLAEAGTGSPADNVNFLTVWGYTVPAGYTFSKCEDGIRAYTNGTYFATAEDRRTTNITARNCTVKNMRGAFPLALAAGDKIVENGTAIECEEGFSVGGGAVVTNGSADAKYGPLFVTTYQNNSNTTADITILNSDDRYGPHPVAYIGASSNDITFQSDDDTIDQNYYIQLAGHRVGMRFLSGEESNQNDHTASSIILNNQTLFPILLNEDCSNSQINSCGTVIDNGSGNSVTNCDDPCGNITTNSQINAENFCSSQGVDIKAATEGGSYIGGIQSGDYLSYGSFNFDENTVNAVEVAIGKSSTKDTFVEVRLDSSTGTLIGTVDASETTGGSQNWMTKWGTLDDISGEHEIFLVFTGQAGVTLVNFNWFRFYDSTLSIDENDKSFIDVYPNPVIDNLFINNYNNEDLNFEIYNSLGQLKLKNQLTNNQHTLDMSTFSSGIYFIKVFNSKGVEIKKIVKK